MLDPQARAQLIKNPQLACTTRLMAWLQSRVVGTEFDTNAVRQELSDVSSAAIATALGQYSNKGLVRHDGHGRWSVQEAAHKATVTIWKARGHGKKITKGPLTGNGKAGDVRTKDDTIAEGKYLDIIAMAVNSLRGLAQKGRLSQFSDVELLGELTRRRRQ